MVDKAIELAHTVAKFGPNVCTPANAFVIIICFSALGLLAGFFIGTSLTP